MRRDQGFTMMELVFAMIIISIVFATTLPMISTSIRHSAQLNDSQKLRLLIHSQKEVIEAAGFWVWEGDTDAQANVPEAHPFSEWVAELRLNGYNRRALMEVTFLKFQGGAYVPFDNNANFDNDEPRDVADITLTLFKHDGNPISHTLRLSMYRNITKLWAAMNIVKRGLKMYEEENGAFPATSQFPNALVPDFLDEIPNNPYTRERRKVTHVEEAIDYDYENVAGVAVLSSNARRDTISLSIVPD